MPEKRLIDFDKGTRDALFELHQAVQLLQQKFDDRFLEEATAYGLSPDHDAVNYDVIRGRCTVMVDGGSAGPRPPAEPGVLAATPTPKPAAVRKKP